MSNATSDNRLNEQEHCDMARGVDKSNHRTDRFQALLQNNTIEHAYDVVTKCWTQDSETGLILD